MRLHVISIILLSTGVGSLCGEPAANPAGISNFHQVNDRIYRGAQPSAAGIQGLAKLGVRTVIDLREGEEHGNAEKKLVEAAGMHYIHVPMAGLSAPKDEQIGSLLNLLDDSSAWPVFVHCKRGVDRTGTVIACYRISHDHWDNQKALREARLYGMHRVEFGMHEYIAHFETTGKATLSHAGLKPSPVTP